MINFSLVKSTFNSLQDYKHVVGEGVALEQQLRQASAPQELEMTERVKIELHGKKFSGEAVCAVPVVDKATGAWDNEKEVPLKLVAND